MSEENENDFIVYGDRDELRSILICRKLTFSGAACSAADAAEFWERITIYQGDNRRAVLSLKGMAA